MEIQQHACDVRPGGEFGASLCAEAGGQRQISGGQQRARRLRIGAVEPEVFVEQTGRRAHFLGAGRALQRAIPGKGQPRRRAAATLADDPRRQRTRRLDVGRIVEEHERLLRQIGAVALGDALLAARRIEREQARVEKRPLPPDVQAPPILRVAAIDRVVARRKIQILPVAIRLVGLHAGPANLRRQQPADRQRRVAHPLRLEAGSALPRVLTIIRVSRELRRRRGGNLAVSRARDDHAHELFHVPAVLHKFAREPIEQRSVGRRFALRAEIARHPT